MTDGEKESDLMKVRPLQFRHRSYTTKDAALARFLDQNGLCQRNHDMERVAKAIRNLKGTFTTRQLAMRADVDEVVLTAVLDGFGRFDDSEHLPSEFWVRIANALQVTTKALKLPS